MISSRVTVLKPSSTKQPLTIPVIDADFDVNACLPEYIRNIWLNDMVRSVQNGQDVYHHFQRVEFLITLLPQAQRQALANSRYMKKDRKLTSPMTRAEAQHLCQQRLFWHSISILCLCTGVVYGLLQQSNDLFDPSLWSHSQQLEVAISIALAITIGSLLYKLQTIYQLYPSCLTSAQCLLINQPLDNALTQAHYHQLLCDPDSDQLFLAWLKTFICRTHPKSSQYRSAVTDETLRSFTFCFNTSNDASLPRLTMMLLCTYQKNKMHPIPLLDSQSPEVFIFTFTKLGGVTAQITHQFSGALSTEENGEDIQFQSPAAMHVKFCYCYDPTTPQDHRSVLSLWQTFPKPFSFISDVPVQLAGSEALPELTPMTTTEQYQSMLETLTPEILNRFNQLVGPQSPESPSQHTLGTATPSPSASSRTGSVSSSLGSASQRARRISLITSSPSYGSRSSIHLTPPATQSKPHLNTASSPKTPRQKCQMLQMANGHGSAPSLLASHPRRAATMLWPGHSSITERSPPSRLPSPLTVSTSKVTRTPTQRIHHRLHARLKSAVTAATSPSHLPMHRSGHCPPAHLRLTPTPNQLRHANKVNSSLVQFDTDAQSQRRPKPTPAPPPRGPSLSA